MRTVVSVQTSLVCSSIVRWGTEEQKQRWLPRLCSGEALGCFGLTEPDTGSDAANQKTRAKKVDGGWEITGNKMWISLGNYAEVALIFAQTDPEKGHRGLAAFLVPTATEGFSSDEIHGKMGLHGSDTAALNLDAVKVDDDALMGEVGEGFKIAMSALDSGRYSVAAGCVGICQGSLDASVAYAKEREQFGRPIGSFQLVQAMIADMRVMTDSARMLVYRAGFLKDQRPPLDDRDVDREAARDGVRAVVRAPGDPGPRRLGLRRRPPGRALLPRRARHDALRGHLADPEADHRARRDRAQRARSVLAERHDPDGEVDERVLRPASHVAERHRHRAAGGHARAVDQQAGLECGLVGDDDHVAGVGATDPDRAVRAAAVRDRARRDLDGSVDVDALDVGAGQRVVGHLGARDGVAADLRVGDRAGLPAPRCRPSWESNSTAPSEPSTISPPSIELSVISVDPTASATISAALTELVARSSVDQLVAGHRIGRQIALDHGLVADVLGLDLPSTMSAENTVFAA